MPNLGEANFVLVSAEGLHDAVDSVARQAENNFHSPIQKSFNQNIGCCHRNPPKKSGDVVQMQSKPTQDDAAGKNLLQNHDALSRSSRRPVTSLEIERADHRPTLNS